MCIWKGPGERSSPDKTQRHTGTKTPRKAAKKLLLKAAFLGVLVYFVWLGGARGLLDVEGDRLAPSLPALLRASGGGGDVSRSGGVGGGERSGGGGGWFVGQFKLKLYVLNRESRRLRSIKER